MACVLGIFSLGILSSGCEKKAAERKSSSQANSPTTPPTTPTTDQTAQKSAVKDKRPSAKQPATARQPATAKQPAVTEPTASVGPLRPPTAKDLKRYTKDLTGSGKLMAKLETSEGTLHCELFEKDAPMTVANFVGLSRGLHPFRDIKTGKIVARPFYDGLTFHRLIPGFMIQGGDPRGNGTGGPGYKFAQEINPSLKHDRPGIMSMANAGPNTNGSQFFIMDSAKPHLDGGYNVFGLCAEVDVVKKIVSVEKRGSKPVVPPTINKVEIYRAQK